MLETPEQFWERAHNALRTPPLAEWDTWPFDGDVTPRELERPVDKEPPRHGEDPVDCRECETGIEGALWHNDRWYLRPLNEPSGLPCVVLLMTRMHVDFTDLDEQHAAELGPLLLRMHRAVMSVPSVGNVHVGRWGEGSAHCHIWFMGRTARLTQLRSSFAAVWDDILPPLPEDVWRANLEHVRAALSG